MPWFGRSKKKEDDDISEQPRRNLPSQIERLLEPSNPRRAPNHERKRQIRRKPSLDFSSDSDEAPNRQPVSNLLKTPGGRVQRSRDKPEHVTRAEYPFSRMRMLGDELGTPVPTRILQSQSLMPTLRTTSPGRSQKTRIVVGIDFGTT
jgi:hypothetical protein